MFNNEEQIILQGTREELIQLIPQVLATHQLLENLDIESNGYDDKEMVAGRRYHPQIRIYFREDSDFKPGNNQPKGRGQNRKSGRQAFRLMNETSETISKGELTSIGRRIKDIFGTNNGYVWNKGKELYCYADWSKGYQLQILAKSRPQASDLVTKILSLQNHSPEWKYLTRTENSAENEAYPETPTKKIMLGKEYTLPTVRPLVDVRFTYAEAKIHRLIAPVVLYDRRGKRANSLVE